MVVSVIEIPPDFIKKRVGKIGKPQYIDLGRKLNKNNFVGYLVVIS